MCHHRYTGIFCASKVLLVYEGRHDHDGRLTYEGRLTHNGQPAREGRLVGEAQKVVAKRLLLFDCEVKKSEKKVK